MLALPTGSCCCLIHCIHPASPTSFELTTSVHCGLPRFSFMARVTPSARRTNFGKRSS